MSLQWTLICTYWRSSSYMSHIFIEASVICTYIFQSLWTCRSMIGMSPWLAQYLQHPLHDWVQDTIAHHDCKEFGSQTPCLVHFPACSSLYWWSALLWYTYWWLIQTSPWLDPSFILTWQSLWEKHNWNIEPLLPATSNPTWMPKHHDGSCHASDESQGSFKISLCHQV